jgi:hypothetical protein
MCFGSSKPQATAPAAVENQAAAAAQVETDMATREEDERRAKDKAEDITEALTARSAGKGKRGGSGRKSLLTSTGGGFLGRFE